MADRIDSDDLRFVLMSVTIQREIGGSLAELFQTVSDTVRAAAAVPPQGARA